MEGTYTPIDRRESATSTASLIPEPTSHSSFWPHLSLSSNYNAINNMSDEVELRVNRKSTRRRGLMVVSGIFFLLLFIAAIVVLVLLLFIVGQQPPRVLTSCGTVQGVFNTVDKVFSFKGIPFAAPPIGERRWKPPEPLTRSKNGTCWSGILEAKKDPVECAQMSPKHSEHSGSEDCLYLSVYTPTLDVRNPRPVMVWIHGGYLQWGNGSIPTYSPSDKLTKKSNAVHVSIQYRVAAFGFLVLDALSGNGNYGILDQVEALRWVKQNIASFGGDPEKVTIWGQSSGGTAAWALMMAPKAKGLFHRVWSLSASPIFNKTIAEAKEENKVAFIKPNSTITQRCKYPVTEDCLISLSTQEVASMVYPFWDILTDSMDLPTLGYFEPALLVVDGELFPQSPFDAWKQKTGNYSDVPVIFGSTAQEMDLNPAPGEHIKGWKRSTLEEYVKSKLDPFGGELTNRTLTLYPATHDAEYSFTTMTSDLRVGCMNDVLLGLASEALTSPVYRYVVTSKPSTPIFPLRSKFKSKYAFHTWDALAFFDDLGSTFPKGTSKSDDDFRDVLQGEVMAFVDKGVPKNKAWLQYPNNTALIASTLSFVDRFNKEQCEMWDDYGVLSYAWVN